MPQVVANIVGTAFALLAFLSGIHQPWRGVAMLLALICFGFCIWWQLKSRGGE